MSSEESSTETYGTEKHNMNYEAPVHKNGWSGTNTKESFSIDENASARQPITKEVTFYDNFSVEQLMKNPEKACLRCTDLAALFAEAPIQSAELEINLDHSNEEPAVATRTLGKSNVVANMPVIQKVVLVDYHNGNENVKFGASLNMPQSTKSVNTSSGQKFDFTMDPRSSKSNLNIVLFDASTLKAESGELKGHTIESLFSSVQKSSLSRKVLDTQTNSMKKIKTKVLTISDPKNPLFLMHEKCQAALYKKAVADKKDPSKYAPAKETDDGYIMNGDLLLKTLKPQLSNFLKSESKFNINDFEIKLDAVLPSSLDSPVKTVSSLASSYKSEKNEPKKIDNNFKKLFESNAMDIGLQKSLCNKPMRESTASIVAPMSVTLSITAL